jgi:hypothetical protein
MPKKKPTPHGKITTITEHFQRFLADLKESFWGILKEKTRLA